MTAGGRGEREIETEHRSVTRAIGHITVKEANRVSGFTIAMIHQLLCSLHGVEVQGGGVSGCSNG